MTVDQKPLGQKAYGHIAHLPGSRMGPGDSYTGADPIWNVPVTDLTA